MTIDVRFALLLVVLATSGVAADDQSAVVPSFVNDVEPILTRLGCNSGACHGKLAGQNGFKLSLRGYAPELDHIAITRDSRGRRIAKSRPRESLLLAKPLMRVPHLGGHKLTAGSPEYRTLLAWIAAGVPGPAAKEPRVERIRLEPASKVYAADGVQPLKVTARYSDGAERDVTRLALFKSNDEALASVNEDGMVKANRPGATGVMASFQGQVAVHVVTTPYDQAVDATAYRSRANYIDDHVMTKLAEVHLEPSPPCDDTTYLRRVSLDLAGILPEPEEVVAFLADRDTEKRRKLVDRLLESPAYVDSWTLFWGELFQNRLERDGDKRGRKGVRGFARWIREAVAQNWPWDRVVREMITARGPLADVPSGGYFLVNRKPEDLAEAATHAFLGTRMQCAKCHNHPLERFTQDDYYGMAAFFSRVKLDGKATDEGPAVDTGLPGRIGRGKGAKTEAQRVGITQPRTNEFLPPRPLDRSSLAIDDGDDPRERLADWMTSKDNPLFARAVVNRVWKRFFAVGLVEPVDDLRATNPATNEPLLQALCDDLVRHDFDLKHLMRTILASRTYALASEPSAGNSADHKFFSHYYPRRLPAEVLADALTQVTGVPEPFEGYAVGLRAVQLPDVKVQSYLLDTFGRPERVTACACERSSEVTMPQTLHLINGESLDGRINAGDGRLKAVLASGKADREAADELFLLAFARRSTDEQWRAVESALARSNEGREEVFRDLLWALVNSKEFLFSH
jgi:hypothetical protein